MYTTALLLCLILNSLAVAKPEAPSSGVQPAAVSNLHSFGDIAVRADVIETHHRRHGYVECRITVTNGNVKAPHDVTLTIPGTRYTFSNGLEISRTISIQPSSTITVSMFVPIFPPLPGTGLRVALDGVTQDPQVGIGFPQYSATEPVVLISQDAFKKNFETNAIEVLKDKAGNVQFSANSSEIPVAEWSRSWIGYSSYDGVVVTAEDMRAVPGEVSSAVLRYVECGGTLLVLGSWEVPEPWGFRKQDGVLLPTYCTGFGQCIVTARQSSLFDEPEWRYLLERWTESNGPFLATNNHEPTEANRMFPVVENLTVPVRGLFLLMLLFVIVIGPINLVVLSKRKRKIWLLWTVPAISLVTCVAVSAYTILSEGWKARARTEALTILDETSHRATTIGWSAFYAPLTPGDGLHYGYETEVWMHTGYSYSYGRHADPIRTIDLTGDQHLTDGWVNARVPAHFKLRKSEMRRERMTLDRRSDGSLVIVNGLGADVRELVLADREGKVYTCGKIPAGQSAALLPQPNRRVADKAERLRTAFSGSEWFGFSDWIARADTFLMAGSYIALMDSSPFVEEGLRSARTRKGESVVYGIMKPE